LQVKTLGKVAWADLVRMNYRNVKPEQLKVVLETLAAIGSVKIKYEGEKQTIVWKGLKK
jgi:hypothetical protein